MDKNEISKSTETIPTLPPAGYSRFNQIKLFFPVTREKWRTMVRQKRAPQPVVLSSKHVIYKNSEVIKFLADPVNYQAT